MSKYNCVICGSPSIDEYCFRHKTYPVNKTPIRFKRKDIVKATMNIEDAERMWRVWREIWNERPHKSELSETPLGDELRSYYVDHLLEKAIYEDIKYEKWNMILLTAQEHEDKYRNPHPKHTELINKAKQRYEDQILK